MSYKEYTVKVYADGTKEWFLNGKLHREDGPAVEYTNGSKFWYQNGEYHREDDPAVEWANGSKEWYLNGKLHRENGPAVEYPDGSKEWFLNGEECTEAEFLKKTSRIEEVSSSETEEVIISMERLATFLHDEGWYTKEHIAIQAINKIKELNEKLTRNSS
jgi:hypothetical protein